MFRPRVMSLVILSISIASSGLFFALAYGTPVGDRPEIAAFVAGVISLYGVFTGIGGVFVSFGTERVDSGCFQLRKNWIGHCISSWCMDSHSRTFCEMSALVGVVMLWGLGSLFALIASVILLTRMAAVMASGLPQTVYLLYEHGQAVLRDFGIALALVGLLVALGGAVYLLYQWSKNSPIYRDFCPLRKE